VLYGPKGDLSRSASTCDSVESPSKCCCSTQGCGLDSHSSDYPGTVWDGIASHRHWVPPWSRAALEGAIPTTAADGRRPPSRPVARLVTLGVIGWLVLALASVLIIPGLLHPLLPASELQRVNPDQQLQHQQEQRKLQNEARTALIQGLVGLLALSGAAIGTSVAWRQLQDNRRHQQHNEELSREQLQLSREQLRQALDTSQEQLRLTQEELRLTREGQVTERFTRAIDQLGHVNLDVRLGGIYALERIAGDSSQDKPAITEVLTAFVRGHAAWPPSSSSPHGQDPSTKDLSPFQVRAQDVQAAVTVLGRPPIGPAQRLDLAATDLRGANLRGAQLQQANLRRAQLQEADLQHAQLREADLRRAQLQKADLQHAQLREANLDHVQLRGAYLQHAELQGADLSDAELQGANLGGAQLQGANLRSAHLEGANLRSAHLEGANLGGAQLQEAILGGAQLQKAWLRRVQLQGADLRDAQLQGADLRDAQLQGADLRDAQLQGADLGGARLQKAQCNAETAWPPGFDWHAAGVKAGEAD
jgi:uncharacterized protein YjbI with pentapeptide repeats